MKLERTLELLNRQGISCETLSVLSGFRTPAYNRAIGNVRYSRHQWGDAADVYVDRNQDGRMDDLNRDGRIDEADAGVLYRLVNRGFGNPDFRHLAGGLAPYRPNQIHGPFVHIDARGMPVRWNRDLIARRVNPSVPEGIRVVTK